jgi:hypothetical protein
MEGWRKGRGRERGREGKGIGMELVLCPRKKKQKSAPVHLGINSPLDEIDFYCLTLHSADSSVLLINVC